ncbi:MAG: hypothetical protein EOP52_07265 [Sphingobacteriales bacterium]|nr:MAG: hypothetical protein EOP52_07265 [Sphingobacteriales bacterium]
MWHKKDYLLTQENLDRYFSFGKSVLKRLLQKENYPQALQVIETLCRTGYTYNFVTNFFDQELENALGKIATSVLPSDTPHKSFKNKAVLYDYFVLENRGFTQQYLKYLIDHAYDIVYVCHDHSQVDPANSIIRSLNAYNKARVISLNAPTILGKAQEFHRLIATERPAVVFVHTAPWEVYTPLVASSFNQSETKFYLLNITDHTFWPGIFCYENIIDFRYYGYYVNRYLKGKSPDNLYIVHTPSYEEESIPFEGFPEKVKGKIIGFGGGAYYKINDGAHVYVNLIFDLLRANKDFIFLFANVGGKEDLEPLIEAANLQERFILLGNRKDITAVFRNIDIMFNTFPYGGGLMLQYALMYQKPLVALWDGDMLHTRLDMVTDRKEDLENVVLDRAGFLKRSNELIEAVRMKKPNHQENASNPADHFDAELTAAIQQVHLSLPSQEQLKIDQTKTIAYHIKANHGGKAVSLNLNAQFTPALKGLPKGIQRAKNAYYRFVIKPIA